MSMPKDGRATRKLNSKVKVMEAGGTRMGRVSLGWGIDQQPRQIVSLRSTAASSSLICSRSLAFCDGTSDVCGWRWPTGAPRIDRVFCISDGGAVREPPKPSATPHPPLTAHYGLSVAFPRRHYYR